MVNTTEVKTGIGTFILQKPKAGVRNKALIFAENSACNVSKSKFLVYLIPKCVTTRPDNIDKDVPIEQVLDSLETEDYDLFVDAMEELLAPSKNQEVKENEEKN